jgi:hypothetical protein
MNVQRIEGVWRALSVAEMVKVMAPLRVRWWVAGGWAVDLFLQEQTRPHADIDIAMPRADAAALRPLGASFAFCIAHDGKLIPWTFEALAEAHHSLWVRRHGEEAWSFEVLFERDQAGAWVYRRDARINMPLDRLGRVSADGVPYIAPEVALLYKAKAPMRDRDDADFARMLPRLSPSARAWLRGALDIAHPGHTWRMMLANGEEGTS